MERHRDLSLLSSAMDPAATLKRLGDDVELMEQIIAIFLEDAPTLVHACRDAMARGDAAELRRAAHSIKGMMATLSAMQGVNAAFRLEQCAAAGDLPAASSLIHEVGEHVAEVTHALQAYCNAGPPAGVQAAPVSSGP